MVVKRGIGLSRPALKRRFRAVGHVYAQNTNEFLKNTTIHGLNYINRKDLYVAERLYFALGLLTVVLLCAYFILNVYVKWIATPVILSISSKPTYITQEPFPAVTVCNLNQARKVKVKQFSKSSVEYAMLQMVCKRKVNATIAEGISNWNMVQQFIRNISQPCSNMLLGCRFGAAEFNCSELFHTTISDGGVCCTFNMVDLQFSYKSGKSNLDYDVNYPKGYVPVEWSVASGYANGMKLPRHYTPLPTVGIGESLGLSIILNVEAEDYYCSSANGVAFTMSVHNPNEIPNIREVGILISPGFESKIRVLPVKFESDRTLIDTDKKKRKCLFEHEGKLQIFSHYSPHNCEHECVARVFLDTCGCQTHFMPRLHANTTTCSIYDTACVERVRLRAVSESEVKNCHALCLPGCFDLDFSADVFKSPLSHAGFQISSGLLENLSSAYVEKNIAVVNLYMKEFIYRSYRRSEYTGAADVLSNVGGLIGLFFGFSFISLAEFIFYAVIRPCRPMRQTEQSVGNKAAGKYAGRPYPLLAGRARNRFRNPSKYPYYPIYSLTRSNRLRNADNSASNGQLQRNMVGAALKHELQQQTLRR